MAPLAEDTTQVEWADARQLVLDAFADFSTETGDIVERFFRESWIDAPPRDGKRSGAFCATNVPGVHPYVFMNYTGDRRSVLTLAHELGHGLHGYLAQPLGLFNASTPLTTAETASVFGEALTFKRLLAIEEDPQPPAQPARRADRGLDRDRLPADRDEPLRGRRAHDAARRGRALAGEVRGALARLRRRSCSATRSTSTATRRGGATSRTSSGRPGYVYAYSYGFLFALSIFRKYELEGDSMVEPYLDVLRAGGSKPPEELAEMVGLDLTDRRIWDAGIDALAAELDEAEALAADIGL